MSDWKQDRIGAAVRGENPTVMVRMRSGFAVIGDSQMLPGYCVLLAYPQVNHLSEMSMEERSDFLLDMSLLGEAIEAVYGAWRINYAIYGNYDEFVHAHVIPRYSWEPDEYRTNCPMRYPLENWRDPAVQYSDELHGARRAELTAKLQELMEKSGLTLV